MSSQAASFWQDFEAEAESQQEQQAPPKPDDAGKPPPPQQSQGQGQDGEGEEGEPQPGNKQVRWHMMSYDQTRYPVAFCRLCQTPSCLAVLAVWQAKYTRRLNQGKQSKLTTQARGHAGFAAWLRFAISTAASCGTAPQTFEERFKMVQRS